MTSKINCRDSQLLTIDPGDTKIIENGPQTTKEPLTVEVYAVIVRHLGSFEMNLKASASHSTTPFAAVGTYLAATELHFQYANVPLVQVEFVAKRLIGVKENSKSSYKLKVIVADPDQRLETDWTTSRDGAVSWDKRFHFDARLPTKLKVEVFKCHNHWHKLSPTTLIASLEEDILDLLESIAVPAEDITKSFNVNNAYSIIFNISKTDDGRVEANAVAEANDVSQSIQAPGLIQPFATALNNTGTIVDNMDNFAVLWNDVWKQAGIFLDWVNGVAEVHPFAKLAVQVLSSVYKVIDAQIQRDKSILLLLRIMSNAYDFGREAEPVKAIESQRIALKCLSQQIIECAYFISAYSKDRRFVVKAVKNLFSNVDDAVQEYKTRFEEIRKAFDSKAILNSEITVLRIAKETFDIAVTLNLNDIPYAKGARYKSEKQCPPGTNTELLDEISLWINDPDDERRVCVLTGSGTSAIAHTIALRMDEIDRLGSSFCFDSKKLAKRGPSVVFPTIIGDLALRDPLITKSLVEITGNDRSLRNTESLRQQFDKLVLKPVETISTTGPIVVVIDALDQSGDADARHDLLELLANRLQELPRNFRFFLTSLPENDVLERFRGQEHILFKEIPFVADKAAAKEKVGQVEKSADSSDKAPAPYSPNRIENSYRTENKMNQDSENNFSVHYDYDFNPNDSLPDLHHDRRPLHEQVANKEPKDYFPNSQHRPPMIQPLQGSGTLVQKSFNLKNDVTDNVGNDYSQKFGGSRSTSLSSGKRTPSPDARPPEANDIEDGNSLLNPGSSNGYKTIIVRSGNTSNTLVKNAHNDHSITYGRKAGPKTEK